MMKERASSADLRLGANPPSSPTLVACPASLRPVRKVWKISEPMRTASAHVGAPTGMIMNSWMSMGLSAWAPPLTMFIIGTPEVAVEWQAGSLGRRLSHRQGHTENGVSAQSALIGRAIEFAQRIVDT